MRSTNLPETNASDDAPLDQSILEGYRSRKSNLLERLISAWLEEGVVFFKEMRDGYDAKDFNKLREGAHALKSCSMNLGAVALAKTCLAIEAAAHAEDAEAVDAAMDSVGALFFNADQALRYELLRLNPEAEVFHVSDVEEPQANLEWS